MAIPQYDAAGDLLAWKLEHTAQQVDDMCDRTEALGNATQSTAGLMSAADKTKLDAVNLDTITYDETTHTITVPSTRGTYADGTITFTS